MGFTGFQDHGNSPVAKTMGIHPKLMNLIRINDLEYRIYESFFDISNELDQEWPV